MPNVKRILPLTISSRAHLGSCTLYLKKINYKPVSRILYPDRRSGGYHLSCPAITDWIILPTHPTYSSRLSREKIRTSRPSTLVYMAFQHARFTRPAGHPAKPWALTPHFHLYPPAPLQGWDNPGQRPGEGSNFLWHCLFPFRPAGKPTGKTRPGYSPVHCPMLSRLSSPDQRSGAIARFVVNCKGSN